MFAALPKAGEPYDKYYGSDDSRTGNGAGEGRGFGSGRWYDFYGANLQRTYGGDALDQPRWVTHTLDRLQAWGFNTVGNWSDPDL
ncbi:hypothetical protein KIN13_15095, partial [Vibrio cholerae]